MRGMSRSTLGQPSRSPHRRHLGTTAALDRRHEARVALAAHRLPGQVARIPRVHVTTLTTQYRRLISAVPTPTCAPPKVIRKSLDSHSCSRDLQPSTSSSRFVPFEDAPRSRARAGHVHRLQHATQPAPLNARGRLSSVSASTDKSTDTPSWTPSSRADVKTGRFVTKGGHAPGARLSASVKTARDLQGPRRALSFLARSTA